jgi:uncharacterized paraquat-inducible protein A
MPEPTPRDRGNLAVIVALIGLTFSAGMPILSVTATDEREEAVMLERSEVGTAGAYILAVLFVVFLFVIVPAGFVLRSALELGRLA